MKRIRKYALLVLALFVAGAIANDVYAQMRLQRLMFEKLQAAQKLLEGIALGKTDQIERQADELIRISKTAEWLAQKAPRYEQFSNEFTRAAETIVRKAKAKNLDGATLAYFDLTMSCVRCHQHLREVRDARGPGMPGMDALAALAPSPMIDKNIKNTK